MPADNRSYDRNFGFLIHDVSRLMRTTFDQLVRDAGLTRSQWRVLAHLLRHDGKTQAEIAEELDIGRASLGTLLDKLEAKGWVRRETCAADRRAKRVYHTDRVKPVLSFMRDAGTKLYDVALAGLSQQDQDRMIDDLVRIKSNLLTLNASASKPNGLVK